MSAIFALRLREAREQHGLSQMQLAQKARVTGRAIGYYESQQRIPNIDIALRIMDVLECPFEQLFGTNDERETAQTKRAHAAT